MKTLCLDSRLLQLQRKHQRMRSQAAALPAPAPTRARSASTSPGWTRPSSLQTLPTFQSAFPTRRPQPPSQSPLGKPRVPGDAVGNFHPWEEGWKEGWRHVSTLCFRCPSPPPPRASFTGCRGLTYEGAPAEPLSPPRAPEPCALLHPGRSPNPPQIHPSVGQAPGARTPGGREPTRTQLAASLARERPYRQRLLSLGSGPRFQAAVNAKGSDAGFGDGAHRGAGWGEVKRGSGPGRRVAALRAGTERLKRRCLPRQQHGVRARLGVRQPACVRVGMSGV